MNVAAIDLNLLLVLHVVLEERSATRAAKRLHVTQSAVSNSLARLRDLLGDPLVVRHARGLAPTPRALDLAPELARVVAGASSILAAKARFDPATTTREFSLACADYYGLVFAPPLVAALRERAPSARLRILPLEALGDDALATKIDLHVGRPPRVPAGCHSAPLLEDRFVCLVPASRAPHRKLSMAEYLAAPHVRVSVLGAERDAIDDALAERGLARNVVMTVPHFSMVPFVVARTGLVATLSRQLAETYVDLLPIAVREPPLAIVPRPARMIWHARTDADEGARFFRGLVRSVAREGASRAGASTRRSV